MCGMEICVTRGDPFSEFRGILFLLYTCKYMAHAVIEKGSQQRRSTPTQVGGRTKPILSPDYVVGLVDGEGCFYVNIAESPRYKAGARIGMSLHVKMQARDREILERVKETIGCGSVYFQKEQRRNHTQCFRYTVGSQRDIISKVIPFFIRYPLQCPSKRQNFSLFCTISKLVEERLHLTKDGIKKIRLLKNRMNRRTVGLA